jgi:hypothetical protein
MIFFMVMPGLVGGFGNYLLPIHCGSPDMAKLNLGSIYYKIEAKISSIDKLLPLTKMVSSGTLAQKACAYHKEERLGEITTPKALHGSQGQIELLPLISHCHGNDQEQRAKVHEIKNKNKNKNSYLAGLFEGDGHIWLPNLNLKKKHNPRFCITFGLKNEPLAKKILEIIEYGHIRYKPKENACVLIVSPVKGLKKIITLINGELRTPKIQQFHKLID